MLGKSKTTYTQLIREICKDNKEKNSSLSKVYANVTNMLNAKEEMELKKKI